jgi:hypothetical protein
MESAEKRLQTEKTKSAVTALVVRIYLGCCLPFFVIGFIGGFLGMLATFSAWGLRGHGTVGYWVGGTLGCILGSALVSIIIGSVVFSCVYMLCAKKLKMLRRYDIP